MALHEIWRSLANDCRGVTAPEYGIIAAAIIVALVASLSNVGQAITNLFNSVANSM